MCPAAAHAGSVDGVADGEPHDPASEPEDATTWTPFVKTTPQKTRFRDVKYARNGIQIELTMPGHNRTTTSRRTELLHLVLRMRGEMQLTNETILLGR